MTRLIEVFGDAEFRVYDSTSAAGS